MNKINKLMVLGILSYVMPFCWADDLVPATTDDINNFDNQLGDTQTAQTSDDPTADDSTQNGDDSDKGKKYGHHKDDRENKGKKEHKNHERKDNFGAIVSAEAKKLKDLPKDQRKDMGKWVSEQRRKNDHSKGAGGSVTPGDNNSTNGSTHRSEAQSSAPDSSGGSDKGSGHSSEHRK